ncbi:hypothetical protein PPERSA_06065 [Pseudocohnilembus persalinus]|uniref:EamA domain-containing protein n=1 Tax=Pseudocohnilembus persalinus TaxID=266149 RepID=A0A0V0QVA2_PSEPJ|nr:hypothetical protein PPERSA_06065 [Pseudocohnilembus persalinus]|eukprot:KRX06183.1 hypothetical protein PPERSA_06065 [Pseudocohnilembus persalinus]
MIKTIQKNHKKFSLSIIQPKKKVTTIYSEKQGFGSEPKNHQKNSNANKNIDNIFQDNNNNEVSIVIENQELQKFLQEKQLNTHRLTMHLGGGFGMNLNDMIVFNEDINQFQSQNDDRNSKISVFFKNERLTLNNPQHLNFINKDKEELEQYFSKDYLGRASLSFSYMILLIFVLIISVIPCWIMNIEAEKYLRQSWRFFMASWLILPFVMWEKRQPKFKKFYQLSYIFDMNNIKKIYLTGFSNALWYTMILFGFEWTYVGYSLSLGFLQPFFQSLQRAKSDSHFYECPGKLLVILGIILIFIECITFNPDDIPPSSYNYIVQKYIHRNVWERCILGNGAALSISYIQTKLAKNNAEVNQIYPPHLKVFLNFFFIFINMGLSSYFFSGCDYKYDDDFWGWTGLFSSHQFSGFFFMSIIIGSGSFILSIYVVKVFQPIEIQIAMSFEPIFSTLLVLAAGVQILPGSLGVFGQFFLIPGLLLINLGQHLKLQEKQKQIEDTINQDKEIIKKMQRQQSQSQTSSDNS